MIEFTINKKSWHYEVAKLGDEWDVHRIGDLCSYIRLVIFGMFKILVCAIAITGFALYPLVSTLMYLGFSFLNGGFIDLLHTDAGHFGVVMMISYAFLGVLILGAKKYNDYKEKHRYDEEKKVFLPKVSDWWNSLTGKVCIKIKFE